MDRRLTRGRVGTALRETAALRGRAPAGIALIGALLFLTACADGASPATATAGPEPPRTVAAPGPPTLAAGPSATSAPVSGGPARTQAAAPAPTAAIPADDAVTIYSLIAHDLVAQAVAASATPTAPTFIGMNDRAGQGELLDTEASNATIPDDLIDNMADLGATVVFTPFMQAIGPLDDGGTVRDDGIYLTFGVLEPQGDAAHVAAYASYYRGADDATGYRYTLEKAAGGPWVIKDRRQIWDH
jgi:hypothetical protein